MAKKKKKNNIVAHVSLDGKITKFDDNNKQDNIVSHIGLDGSISEIEYESKKQNNKKDTWFEKGAFDDGYQFGDFSKTVVSSLLDVGTNATKGVMKFGEGIGDTLQYSAADVIDFFGNDKKADEIRNRAKYNAVDSLFEPATKVLDQNSVFGEKSDSISEGLGYVAAISAVSMIPGGMLGTSSSTAATITSTAATFTSSYGHGVTEALNSGATIDEARIYGAISGAAEAGSELMFGGLGKISSAMGLSKGALDDVIVGGLTKKIKNKMVKTVMQAGLKAGGEGLEEIVSGFMSAVAKKVTYMKKKDFDDILKDENLMEQFWMGAITSAISQGPSTLRSIRNGTDFVTGRTDNEQKVYDNLLQTRTNDAKVKTAINNAIEQEKQTLEKLYGRKLNEEEVKKIEQTVNAKYKNGKIDVENTKLSNKEQTKIEETVNKDLEAGNISSEQLREILGENQDLSKDKLLMKSVYENTQKYASYKVEKTNNEKINVLLQSAADAGLNNTSKTRRKVELISKLVKDTDRQYKFVSPEQLKQLGYREDANGLIDKSTGEILINSHSDRGIQAVVGHETTHIFDSKDNKGKYSKEYIALQDAVIEYAKTKGIYENAVNDIADRYGELLSNESEVKEELTADLIGDLLFNDEQFIESLATKNRNIFQKIYDYIKHIYNITKADTEEAKALEEVKYRFDKVYKNISKETNNESNKMIKYLFGGEKSKLVDTQKLKTAKSLENKVSPEKIWKDTGWFKGAEGKWRYELDDSKFKLFQNKIKPNTEYSLLEIFDAKELYDSYEELTDLKVVFGDFDDIEYGAYRRNTNKIYFHNDVINDKNLQSVFKHEIQHVIQRIEGFSAGSSTEFWEYNGSKVFQERIDIQKQNICEEIAKSLSLTEDDAVYNEEYFAQNFNLLKYEDLSKLITSEKERKNYYNMQFAENIHKLTDDEIANIDKNIKNASSKIKEYLEEKGKIEKELLGYIEKKSLNEFDNNIEKYIEFASKRTQQHFRKYYLNTAGEQEARLVEIREDLDKKQKEEYVPIYWNDDTVFVDNLDKILYNENQTNKSGSGKNANLVGSKIDSNISQISKREEFLSNNRTNTYRINGNEQGKTINLSEKTRINSKQRNDKLERSQKNIGTNQGLEESSSFSLPKLQKGYVRLYRGLNEEYNPNYDRSKIDNVNGYESWTDSYELAKSYGENVYYIDIPASEIKNDIIDEDSKSDTYGDRNLLYKNDKPVGINGKSGNEYMLYTDHDNYSSIKYNKIDNTQKNNKGVKQSKQALKKQFEELTGVSISRAEAILAGIEVRNMQRKNRGETNFETSPYSEEVMEILNKYQSSKESSNYLFHSTSKENLQSILEKGLTTGNKQNQAGVSSADKIYLATSEELANSFGHEDDVIFRVNPKFEFENLENDLLGGEGTYSITNNIPPEYLQVKENGKWVKLTNSKLVKDISTNTKDFLSTTDNQGRKLTKKQQEYFKNSKIRDDNGNLLEVYHGTNSEFNVFDINYLGSASGDVGFLGDGFYFATHKGEAKYYGGNIKNVYLNVTNPFNIKDLKKYRGVELGGETSNEFLEIKNLVDLNEDWGNIEINSTTFKEIQDAVNDYLENVKIKKAGTGEDYFGEECIFWEIIYKGKKKLENSIMNYSENEILADSLNNAMKEKFGYINSNEILQYITEEKRLNNGKSFQDVLKEKGYDGIIQGSKASYTDEIVVFNSNQIKNVDNLNPTEETDIRYSVTENKITGDDIAVKDLLKQNKTTIDDMIGQSENKNTVEDILMQTPEEKQQGMKEKAKKYINRSKTKFINNIVDSFGTSKIANTKTLNSVIDEIRTEITKKGNLTAEKTKEYFDKLYNNLVKMDTLYYDTYKNVKDDIRNTKIYISDSISNDTAFYNDFRKKNMGTMILTKDDSNIPVDVYYMEMSEMYPELFPSDIINPTDQLQRISDVAKDISKVETNVAAYNDKYMGKEYRLWAKEEFDKYINDFTRDIKMAERYNNESILSERAILTKEEIKESYKKLPQAKRIYEKALAKEVLTKEDKLQVDRLVNNEIDITEISKGSNKEGIIRLARAKTEYNRLQKEIQEYQKNIKEYRIQQAKEDIGNIDLWKDKNLGFKYSRETPVRNIYDIAPKDVAEKIANKYFRTYSETNEKKVVDTINTYNDRIRNLDIDTKNKYNVVIDSRGRKVSESALVQLLGEGKITSEDIKDAGANVNKIENAVKEFRNIYNELITQINESMLENGYAPVEYRKDYFPHFTEEKTDTLLGKAAKLLGINVTNREELPTDIAGQTANFKPGRTWFGNLLQRTTDLTDYDALKGFDKYVRGAADLIYHTGDIQNLRALSTAIRGLYNDTELKNEIEAINESPMTEYEKSLSVQEVYNRYKDKSHLSKFIEWLDNYTNILAGKKAINDRGAEKELNRQMYKTMQDIESRIAANTIGGNIGVSLTNFAPISQAWGEIKTHNLLNGMWQTMKSAIKKDSSFASESQFITRRRGADRLVESTVDKITKPINTVLGFADNFTSEVIVRSRYIQNLQEGMSKENALEEADRYASGLMADRGRGALPTQFSNKNPISKMINMFQTEVNNQWSYYLKDLPKNLQEKANGNKTKVIANTALAYTKIMVGAHLINELLGTVRGNSTRVLPDPIYIIGELIKGLSDDDDENDDETVISTITEVAGNIPFVSLPATLFADSMGLDVGDIGRVSISGAIPNVADITSDVVDMINKEQSVGDGLKSIGSELLDTAGASLLLPYGGGQIRKTVKGLSLYENDLPGNYTESGDLRYTVEDDVGSKIKSAIFGAYANPYAQDYIESGFKTIKKENIDEMVGLDMNSTEYRQYKTKLNKFSNKSEKLNYIDSLDLEDSQKSLAANNLNKNAKKRIDMSEYGNYSSYEEYTYARDYPEKYVVASQIATYDEYMGYKDAIADIKEQYSTEAGYSSSERKQLVQNYINTLDLDMYQKIMLEKMAGGYSIKNFQNYIYEYLESTNLTEKEKYSIWNELFN